MKINLDFEIIVILLFVIFISFLVGLLLRLARVMLLLYRKFIFYGSVAMVSQIMQVNFSSLSVGKMACLLPLAVLIFFKFLFLLPMVLFLGDERRMVDWVVYPVCLRMNSWGLGDFLGDGWFGRLSCLS